MTRPRSAQHRASSPTRTGSRRAKAETRVSAKLLERLMALHDMLERRRANTYRDNIGALIYLQEGDPVPEGLTKVEYEKAPDLATGGSPETVLPD